MENENIKTVYLAGGFGTDWREQVKLKAEYLNYLDPSSHNIQSPQQYTDWDLRAIDESDIIFGYMQESNPGGYALALEIGYAKAKGKVIILVLDRNLGGKLKYFDMVKESSTYVFYSLTDAIAKLNVVAAEKLYIE